MKIDEAQHEEDCLVFVITIVVYLNCLIIIYFKLLILSWYTLNYVNSKRIESFSLFSIQKCILDYLMLYQHQN